MKVLDFPFSTHDVVLTSSKEFKGYEPLYTVIMKKGVIDTNVFLEMCS